MISMARSLSTNGEIPDLHFVSMRTVSYRKLRKKSRGEVNRQIPGLVPGIVVSVVLNVSFRATSKSPPGRLSPFAAWPAESAFRAAACQGFVQCRASVDAEEAGRTTRLRRRGSVVRTRQGAVTKACPAAAGARRRAKERSRWQVEQTLTVDLMVRPWVGYRGATSRSDTSAPRCCSASR